jgi:ATP-dependent DNA helicase RecQ
MLLKVLTLPFDRAERAFDDRALDAFAAEHEVLSASDHLLVVDGEPCWAILLQARARTGAKAPAKPVQDLRADLDPAERDLFDKLRAWRRARAQADGVPPYVLFDNAQLAALAQLRPRTLEQLREIPGVGEKKCARYGQDLLDLVRGEGGRP